MGIGNHDLSQRWSFADAMLITPHGDRKPSTRGAVPSAGAPSHYPSWGSETARPPGALGAPVDSLPLMGIGNGVPSLVPSPNSGSSLPLMGIGNWAFSQPCCRPPTPSLPLMGIGNSAYALLESDQVTCSLPLMGIGNVQVPKGDRITVSLLITPHGDRKRGKYAGVAQWRALDSHYPSWGSETRVRCDCYRCVPHVLITPHGDRKPSSASHASISAACSLPLMGIGNRLLAAGEAVGRLVLITPHGDRKRPTWPEGRKL